MPTLKVKASVENHFGLWNENTTACTNYKVESEQDESITVIVVKEPRKIAIS